MAERANQKLKILKIKEILEQETDEFHKITTKEIIKALEKDGIIAERKSVYSDVKTLEDFGMDIIEERKDRTYYYTLNSREFELTELKLMVDAIGAARFITAKKSKQLIEKIKKLTSTQQGDQLDRQVFANDRVKSDNEKFIYSVDTIYTALIRETKITFEYFRYDEHKKKVKAHDGQRYVVSPWAMVWNEEKYYLVGFDERDSKMKHFRVDKMLDVQGLEEPRVGKEQFKAVDMKGYTDRHFGMFGGEKKLVQLECENGMANVIFDRFGTGIKSLKLDENHFSTSVNVDVSDNFLGWIIGIGGVKVVGPEDVVVRMKELLKKHQDLYD